MTAELHLLHAADRALAKRVAKGDEDALADAMQKMKMHFKDYVPDEIRMYALSRFSEEIILKKLELIYNRCINKRN